MSIPPSEGIDLVFIILIVFSFLVIVLLDYDQPNDVSSVLFPKVKQDDLS